MIKRVFDILGSVILIALLGLPMLLIALAVRIESSGGAVFRQRRAGWRGKPFVMLKFRTMRADVEPYGGSPHAAGDPRLTKVGRWLRAKSLDELPQLFNVLGGQMSLVGPRPLYERQAELWDQRQRHRLDVRPGITGYAQAYGRGSLTIEKKIEMDLHYVENRNLWLDLRIIFRTVANILTGSGEVYEKRYSLAQEHDTYTHPRRESGNGAEQAEKPHEESSAGTDRQA